MTYFEVVTRRKRDDGRETLSILRYETLSQRDAERAARLIYQDEGIIPEIYAVERVPARTT